jgi:3-oxoacyl-[acyl-carrier protein] reductase
LTGKGAHLQTNAINLSDRVAVVTGGAQGIGLSVGRRFLASGRAW